MDADMPSGLPPPEGVKVKVYSKKKKGNIVESAEESSPPTRLPKEVT